MVRTQAGPVTAAERRTALLADQDRRGVETVGAQAAAVLGFHAQADVQRAYRTGGDIRAAVRKSLNQAIPLLTRCMVTGHILGRRRSAALAPRKLPRKSPRKSLALRSTPFDEMLASLQRRMDLDEDEIAMLERMYAREAVSVMATATRAIEQRLEQVIYQGAARGVHVREGVAMLAEAFEAAGLVPNNSFTLEAIFRTQTQIAYGAGRWNADQAPEIQQILWGYKYVTVGDDRVRPEHVGFEGVTLPKDDPQWEAIWPPNGWCCRCSTIPIYEERSVVQPSAVDVDGKIVEPKPDDGFAWNAGMVNRDAITLTY